MARNSYGCANEHLSKTLTILSVFVIFLMCFLSFGGFNYFNFTKVTVLSSRPLVYSSKSRKQDNPRAEDTPSFGAKQHARKNVKNLQNLEENLLIVNSFERKSPGSVALETINKSKKVQKSELADTLTSTQSMKQDKSRNQGKVKGTLTSTQSIKPVKSKELPNTNLMTKVKNVKEVVHVNGIRIEYNERVLQKVIGNISESMQRKERNDTCIQRYPGAAIVGVAKCGTRELSDFMRMHPQIVPRYLNRHYKIPLKLFANISINRHVIQNRMPCTYQDQIGTFKEDSAFAQPDFPRKLHELNPNMKIIALVREPVARYVSQTSFRYLKQSYAGHETEIVPDFRKIFIMNSTVVNSKDFSVKLSTYSECLKRYMEYFPMSQILIIQTEEFNKDPVTVLNRVQEFLGVKKFDFHNHFLVNPESGFHCVKTEEESVEQSIVCYNKNRGRHIEPDLTDAEMQSLQDYFKPFNEELFQLLGQRFDEWEYD